MDNTRYTQKQHQTIKWQGNGIYKWDASYQYWRKLTEGERDNFALDEI